MHKDKGFDLPSIGKYQEKSAVLVEEAQQINVGIVDNPEITFYATYLDPKEDFFFSILGGTKD